MMVGRCLATYKLVTYRIEVRLELSSTVAEAEIYHRSAREGVIITAPRILSKLSEILIPKVHHLIVYSVIGLEIEIARKQKLLSVGKLLDVPVKESYLLRSYVRV